MKIIFLDMDGVLVTGEYIKALRDQDKDYHRGVEVWEMSQYKTPIPWAALDPECVEQLNRIIAETGSKVVVSSAWRGRGVQEMQMILDDGGVKCEVIDTTPFLGNLTHRYLRDTRGRGLEIADWLSNTNHNVESFVILDDDSDMVFLEHKWVGCDPNVGLIKESADIAISLLNEVKSIAA